MYCTNYYSDVTKAARHIFGSVNLIAEKVCIKAQKNPIGKMFSLSHY